MSERDDLKKIADQQDTIVQFLIGYFVLGPIAMFVIVGVGALVAWMIP